MLKLIKYDLIKSRAWYAITAAAVGLIELIYLLGFWFHNDTLFNIGVVLFIMAGVCGLLALLIYSVQLYSEELTKKSGYMTFLTPRSAYQIIGSKLIVSFLALVVGFVVYCILAIVNIQVLQGIQGNLLGELFSAVSTRDIPQILLFLFNSLIQWFATIITIYFSVTLSRTLLGENKFRWLISAAIFVGINTVMGIISTALVANKALDFALMMNNEQMTFSFFMENSLGFLLMALVINFVFAVGFYFGTSYLAEKKLSL